MKIPTSIIFKGSNLYYLDQNFLPHKEIWRRCRNLKDAFVAIRSLKIRGAPLIGVFAGYSIYIGIKDFSGRDTKKFLERFEKVTKYLAKARPTAVNLFWALERIKGKVYANLTKSPSQLKKIILDEAKAIHREDKMLCEKIASWGIKVLKKGDRILTYCNTGFLATGGIGTALGIIYKAKEVYKDIKVIACETRPLLQGARLTMWELKKARIDATLICDDMAGFLMQKRMVDKIIVGADRITRCGDVANKIGTYSLSILAKYHKIPFYVAAPFSTFDLNLEKGEDIPIEERSSDEVRKVLGKLKIAPTKSNVWNPAFDVTPAQLITAIITDKGIIRHPLQDNIKKFFKR